MKKFIKNSVLTILNIVFHFFWLFPVKKNKVFFIAYHGSQYGCSPRFISEKLHMKTADAAEIVWALEDKVNDVPDYIRRVRPKSFGYYKELLTACVIVHNVYIPPWLPYRKKQTVINTWHGGGVCKLPYLDFDGLSKYNKKLLREGTAYFISSSKKFSELVIRGTFGDKREILEIGLPRNDIMFMDRGKETPVHDFYGLDKEMQILLYAPTYRDKESKTFIAPDMERIADEWQKKTGKNTVAVVRYHPLSKDKPSIGGKILDGGIYPDMQELLRETSLFITDYSSAIWDYCLTDKPCLLYIPDEEEYQQNRPMYMYPSAFGLPFCRTQDEISRVIEQNSYDDYKLFDEKYKQLLGSVETGHASDKVTEIICGKINS